MNFKPLIPIKLVIIGTNQEKPYNIARIPKIIKVTPFDSLFTIIMKLLSFRLFRNLTCNYEKTQMVFLNMFIQVHDLPLKIMSSNLLGFGHCNRIIYEHHSILLKQK